MPFALLGAVQILLVAGCAGLGAALLVLSRRPAAVLAAVGALLLAAVEARTALRPGVSTDDVLQVGRAVGAALLAAGLATGGLAVPAARRPVSPANLPDRGPPVLGLVLPLAGSMPVSVLAGTAGLAASAAALRTRTPVARWLAGGLALWALAAVLAPQADHGTSGPLTVVLLRGTGALAVGIALALLAQTSLLTKVVGAIFVGVLVMAVAAVGVVGTVVVSAYDRQSRALVDQAADGRKGALGVLAQQALQTATVAPAACSMPTTCRLFLDRLAGANLHDFVVRIPARGAPESLAGRPALRSSELLGLPSASSVHDTLTLTGAAKITGAFTSLVRLTGSPPAVALVAVVPGVRPDPQGRPTAVTVYGVRIDDDYTSRDLDTGGYGLSFLSGDPLQVVASNRSADERAALLRIVVDEGAQRGVAPQGLTIGSQGSAPTVRVLPLADTSRQPVGLLVMSRDASAALGAERDALRVLLATTLLATFAVALVALLLGRRTVDPVRRLTAAVERVAAGDLTASAGVRSRDEVGTLSTTFDTMTGNLGRLTGDLRDSAARLGTVLASMTDGLLATNGAGTVTSANPAALAMLGLDEIDVLGEPLGVVADVRGATGEQLADAALLLRDEPALVHRADGSTVHVRVALSPLEGTEGVVMVLRDMTREREVERMKTEFLSNVSHELRTPLTPIRGYAEILVGKPGLGSEKVTLFASTILDEALKMNRVVDLLVDVASLEAGRVSVTPRPVVVRDLLDARVAAWQTRAPGRSVTRRAAATLPPVLVDPSWTGKALDELLDNAVKYSTGPVTLIAAVHGEGVRGGQVRVTVRDTGPGIAPKDQELLFTSFEQVDGSATRRVGGLGLGLSFVRRVADDAGWPLTVTSTLGKGSEFSLDLPVVDRPVADSPAAGQPAALPRRRRTSPTPG